MVRLRLATWLHPTSPTPHPVNTDSYINKNLRPTSEIPPTSLEEKKHHHQKYQREESGSNFCNLPQKKKPTAPPIMAPSKMITLAQKISTETEKVEAYFNEHGLQTPSFDVDAPSDFPEMPEDISRSRREIIHATKELQDLMVGPRESVRWMAWNFMDTQSLQLLNHYGIAKLVPIDGSITLSQLASQTTLDSINLTRLLRHGMVNHLFQEPTPGVIMHTAASRLLVEDETLQSWVEFNTKDVYPASAHVIDALKKYPEATGLMQTGFNFAFNTVDTEPMFVTIGKDPKRAKRMGQAMSSLTGGEGYELSHITEACDLTEVDARGGTLVDLGGSHGFVSVWLAQRFRNMQFVVQDLANTIESAPQPVCADDAGVAKRVRLQVHDFFTPQPVRGADVYYFRWIMHNYSTPYAVQIIRALIPALKPGARVVINDLCLSEPGVESPWDERLMRSMDLVMMTLLNAQEREEEDFRQLFKQADEGFVFKGVTRPRNSRMSVIEAVWQPAEPDQSSPAACEPPRELAVI
ncbi:S-adenosyl-L-methionine-dependent methyltransferase [Annulohypoxylon truncatum]|uniref:S-adenosyl-L-methionine-dependent methyltransferase n=1 Tax=Annulohypoxylon truncatum TaxID=327061 RepID=UPI0020083B46|nr:S-adenosyl-L-methionine-dependent methyltransferase [Annulohypoxylon truncatum]KAI1212690.1 S-adenosyl-L-methionine-dependent methyltransferase [Annulohypoxylon truncatum]